MIEVDSEISPINSSIEIRIVEYDGRRLSAQFQCDLLQIAGCSSFHDRATRDRGTREGHLVDSHMRGDSCTGRLSESREDVDDTRREASFNDKFGCDKSGKRRLFCRLQDDDVTGSDSRSNLPCPHEQREVPGDDLSANTNGLVTSISEGEVVSLNNFAVDLVRPSAVVFETISRHGDIALCNIESLAVVECFNSSKSLDLTVH
jgi:hypothetical protein